MATENKIQKAKPLRGGITIKQPESKRVLSENLPEENSQIKRNYYFSLLEMIAHTTKIR